MPTEQQAAVRDKLPHIDVFVLAGNGINGVLAEWLKILFSPEQVHVFDPGREIADPVGDKPIEIVCAARNEIVRRFLADSNRPWLVMFDDDVYPVPETLEMLASDLPFAGCRIWGKAGKESHAADGLVCLSAVKIARTVLEAIDPPHFDYEHTDGDITVCECMYLSKQVRELGHQPTKIGKIGHSTPFVATLVDDGKLHVTQESTFPLPKKDDLEELLGGPI